MYKNNIDSEIRDLHSKIVERRLALHNGLKAKLDFKSLRIIYKQINDLEKILLECYNKKKAEAID